MKMRPYQSDAIEATEEAFKNHKSVLGVMCTGGGKTVVFSHLAKRRVERGRVLVLAHREELLEQASQKIQRVTGIRPELEMGDRWVNEHSVFGPARIVVSSIQTQIAPWDNKRRMHRFNPNDFALVIADEAHHCCSPSWHAVIDYYRSNPNLELFGTTATPKRFDKKALGSVFDVVAFDYNIKDAIGEGWLVPIRQKYVTVDDLNFDEVSTTAGDFDKSELARQMEAEAPLHRIVSTTLDMAGNRKTLIFCTSIKQAEQATELLNRYNHASARLLIGETDPVMRREMLRDFRCSQFQFLLNVGVATEGFDIPDIGCVVMARPTKSAALYCLDAETEILTDRGWRRIDDRFEAGERAAAFRSSDSAILWSTIRGEIRRFMLPKESYWGLRNPHCDIRITDQHNLVARRRQGRSRKRTPWTLMKACALTNDSIEIPVCGWQESNGVPLSDDDIRFLGLWITDGNLNNANGQITLFQSERYPEGIEYINRVLHSCGFKYGHSVYRTPTNFGERTHPLHRWTISKGKPRGRDKDKTGWNRLVPYMDKELADPLEEMTREQLLVFLEAMNIGDGIKHKPATWTKHTMDICTGRPRFADRVQSLCVRRGIRCNIGTGGTNGRMSMLRIRADKASWSIATTRKDRPQFGKLPDAGGLVWCIEVSTGAIVTRRNGKVAILGNCQMLGRGTRPLDGCVDGIDSAPERQLAIRTSNKSDVLIIDFVGNAGKHRIIHVADILGGKYSEEVIDLAKKRIAKSASPDDVDEELRKAEREWIEQQKMLEAEQRARITAKARWCAKDIDPFEIFDICPTRNFAPDDMRPVEQWQREKLEKWRVPVPQTFDDAQDLIDEIRSRVRRGQCTYRQAIMLKRYGYDPNLSFEAASEIMNKLFNKNRVMVTRR